MIACTSFAFRGYTTPPPQAATMLPASISARSRQAELLILCARIGFNP